MKIDRFGLWIQEENGLPLHCRPPEGERNYPNGQGLGLCYWSSTLCGRELAQGKDIHGHLAVANGLAGLSVGLEGASLEDWRQENLG